MEEHNDRFMKKAIGLSRAGMEAGSGGPFGCVVVRNGAVVGKGYNSVLSDEDPTAHAEINAIRDACQKLDTFELDDCVLYTSCEPCPMCLSAIYWARIPEIYYSNTKEDAADIGFDDSFIYEQIVLPSSERDIPMQRMNTEGAIEVFREWDCKEDKTAY